MIVDTFIKDYTSMDIQGIPIHCPYWMNKIVESQVILRGYENGKGSSSDIRAEILARMKQESKTYSDELSIHKLAKRFNIGIDCSGLVYRFLDHLIEQKRKKTDINTLDDIFTGGITKTNAARLTSTEYSLPIENLEHVQIGDMIRLMGGAHIAIVIYREKKVIYYLHSAGRTEIKGAHISKVKIIAPNKSLVHQFWEETGGRGKNFSDIYLTTTGTNGFYRLKIFQ